MTQNHVKSRAQALTRLFFFLWKAIDLLEQYDLFLNMYLRSCRSNLVGKFDEPWSISPVQMLVAVSGTIFSGVELAIKVLVEEHDFEQLSIEDDENDLLDYATRNYTRNLVVRCEKLSLLNILDKRPFFVHISIDSSMWLRLKLSKDIIQSTGQGELSGDELVEFIDEHDFKPQSIQLRERSHIKFKIVKKDVDTIQERLSNAISEQLQILQNSNASGEIIPPLRPNWDTYFMKLATLAASRSNCMKRKVGCVIVRDRRVIATGYNGTPRHLRNCFNGGCPRCNGGDSHALHTCLCLHAEENALLEAGRDRVGTNAILYCDTCPCLTCSVKIAQTGITEVVYSQTYRMDDASFEVLRAAGVEVRQFSCIQEPRIVML